MEVSAQLNSGDYQGQSATVNYAPLDASNLSELVSNFGEDIVFTHAKRSFVVGLQSFIRAQIESGKDPSGVQEAVNDWRPGQKRPGKSPAERIQDIMAKLSPEERDAVLKDYGVKSKRERAAA